MMLLLLPWPRELGTAATRRLAGGQPGQTVGETRGAATGVTAGRGGRREMMLSVGSQLTEAADRRRASFGLMDIGSRRSSCGHSHVPFDLDMRFLGRSFYSFAAETRNKDKPWRPAKKFRRVKQEPGGRQRAQQTGLERRRKSVSRHLLQPLMRARTET